MSGVAKKENIIITNASEHNLKNIDVQIPVNAFTCVTGVSGCGKSSLVYDTIYAESQRNFLEGMSGNLYGQKIMDKPEVGNIENLRPALNVAQKYYNYNPRSTVGTLTDISHYLRALFALILSYHENTSYRENFFSSNNPNSCCIKCNGLGEEYVISERLVIPDEEKSLSKGAILPLKGKSTSLENRLLKAIAERYEIDLDKRFCDLSKRDKDILLYRSKEEVFHIRFKTPKGRYKQEDIHSKGIIVELEEKLNQIDKPSTFASISKYLKKEKCSCCKGTRLKEVVLLKYVCKKNIADVEALPMTEFRVWLKNVLEEYSNSSVIRQIALLITQMDMRAAKMVDLRVDYLSLDRSIPTLSGGEIQRIRIANQLNCSLKGLIYILDEPCRGMHIRDIKNISKATKELTEQGNTVIAIEHNKEYISNADKIIELGPSGGPKGGYVISESASPQKMKYQLNFRESKKYKKYITVNGINYHNIVNQNATFPVGAITCITGISGSGKSSLMDVVENCWSKSGDKFFDSVKGSEAISRVIKVNQQPIGKTPRSTVLSYLEIYDPIRELFADTEQAIKSGLTSSDFSMNLKGGRCECCQGTGLKKIELTYLPDSYIKCPECNGKRFNEKILSVRFKDLSIDDVLDASIDEAIDTFADTPSIHNKLKCMQKLGLGYIKLGQMSMNLSGGEAQRIKLAKALGTKSFGKNLYLLDEPTSGLSDVDIDRIAAIIDELRNNNETILIIEHNAEFVANYADYVIDFGINAGTNGGIIMSQGFPKEVFGDENSSWYQIF